MPEDYYCLDNFFKKMTDLESPRKNNDCYFYYYSTCTKGDNCTFRHEPSALGCETTCSFWKEGKCINVHCNFRHMELRKNRKTIPCYWEYQPGGCKKPHCPFLHSSSKSGSENGETSNIKLSDNQKPDINSKKSDVDNNFGSPVVDPLVVRFEEESDNESAPTQSPIKSQRVVKVKTLEEIKLERIQAESAAYYSYPGIPEPEENFPNIDQPENIRNRIVIEEMNLGRIQTESTAFYSYPEPEGSFQDADQAENLRNRIMRRLHTKPEPEAKDVGSIEILSLEEIRKRKRRERSDDIQQQKEIKRQKIVLNNKKTMETDLSNIKIKSLDEIKAEKTRVEAEPLSNYQVTTSEEEVTSTSVPETSRIQCPVSSTQTLQEIENEDTEMLEMQDEVTTAGKLDHTELDEDILFEEEEDESMLSLKTEEDILNDIDNFLNE